MRTLVITCFGLGAALVVCDNCLLAETETTKINRLIRELGSDSYPERIAASAALEAIGEPALEGLIKAQQHPDAEIRRRAVELVQVIRTRARIQARVTLEKLGARLYPRDGGTDSPIEYADLSGANIGRQELALLRWQDHLWQLNLSRTNVTDADLDQLHELNDLLWLGTWREIIAP
jgi:hypothetical protein